MVKLGNSEVDLYDEGFEDICNHIMKRKIRAELFERNPGPAYNWREHSRGFWHTKSEVHRYLIKGAAFLVDVRRGYGLQKDKLEQSYSEGFISGIECALEAIEAIFENEDNREELLEFLGGQTE